MSPRRTLDNPLGLEPMEGEAVSELGVNLRQQNKVLNDSLMVDAVLQEHFKKLTKGDVVHVVFELTRTNPNFVSAQKHDGWKRVDGFQVTGAAAISADGAVEAIHEQRERVALALEKAAGTQRMNAEGEPGVASVMDAKPEGSEG